MLKDYESRVCDMDLEHVSWASQLGPLFGGHFVDSLRNREQHLSPVRYLFGSAAIPKDRQDILY